ncbi:MAG TPA: SUMF1/EgtB/PvdO family nonheme iron enzyme [Acholeplasma sp.]|nr:SUMF1/EgtB/PvdO family nonheme iron enzyme [Acholeplasma sp.]
MNRGGSWNNNANNCRSANRNNNTPDNRNNNIGFRLVSPKLKRKDGFPLLNRLLSRPQKRQT